MGSFDDLDDALLESVLKFLNSTELRNTGCLVCKRWRAACTTRPGLWRDMDINVAWEIYHPHGPVSHSFPRAVHRGFGAAREGGRGGSRSRNLCGTRGGGEGSSGRRSYLSTFLSRAAISHWLQPHIPHVEILRISNAEMRTSVVGYGLGASDRHDLQPTDLAALLGALPALTELHLTRACNLLPDPAILLHIPTSASSDIAASHSPGPQAQPPAGHGAAAPLQFPAAAAAAAVAEAAGGGGAFPVVAMAGAGLAETAGGHPTLLALPLPTSSGATPPLAERLRLLSLCHAGYDFSTDEGAMQAAALGGLRGLQELTITLEPVAEEGLNRLPESWSLLTGLTALRLGGHQRLRRLPSWLSGSLRRLRELTLTSCGFYRVPAAALAGLAQLRLLSLDSCPLGRGSAAVSLDAWWPPEEGPEGEAQDKGEEAGGSGGEVGRGGESGMARLEVLQLRDCDILALPYTVTRLTNIRRLELGGNPLGELALPVSSGRNSSQMRDVVLRYLKESGDRGFSQLAANTRLKHLGLERCGLKSVPLGVPELTQLASLDLSHNAELELYDRHRMDLPGCLSHLTCLRLLGTATGQQLREAGQSMSVGRELVLD